MKRYRMPLIAALTVAGVALMIGLAGSAPNAGPVRPFSTYQRTATSTTLGPGGATEVAVGCDSNDDIMLSGGYETPSLWEVRENRPYESMTWMVMAQNKSSAKGKFTVHVLCAKPL